MPPSTKVCRTPIVLGIDWGSTAVRLFKNLVKEQRLELVDNRAALSKCDETRYQRGSWSGYINISGNGPVYTGDDVPSALQIPAKLILGRGKGIDSANPLLSEVERRKGDVFFERRCQEGLQEIVKAFASQLQKECESKYNPLEIVDIGLTIPAHWTLEEEGLYTSILKKAFPRSSRWNCRLKNIYFMTEIEAFAHFFFDDPDRVEQYLGDRVNNFVLLLDFGGHSMNGCIFYVRRANDRFAFIRAREPFGIVGGTAQWEAAIGEFCTNNTLSTGGFRTKVTPEVRNSLLRKFREELRMLECDSFREIELRTKSPKGYDAGSGDFWTTISANQSAKFFHDATNGPLGLAESQIKILSSLEGRCPELGARVIVSGGTAKNETII
ncbi:hypothetical protein ColTof3_04015 [Colletotrichum tofieldiae]|nr:hypothetical protein ColTof3_04015 [Colletotrichum tofieldiae]GKT87398.1 hypothetical protein Ct61P_05248 [Colletotrichum tofieldiae]